MANPMVTSSMTYIGLGLGLHAFKYNYLAYVSGKPISIYYLVTHWLPYRQDGTVVSLLRYRQDLTVPRLRCRQHNLVLAIDN